MAPPWRTLWFAALAAPGKRGGIASMMAEARDQCQMATPAHAAF
ncbi:hypothetical protein ACSZNL_13005 [Aeromonas jandaei]